MDLPNDLAGKALNENHAGIVLLDRDQRVVFWNLWLTRHSGIDAEVARGKTLAELFPGTKLALLGMRIDAALTAGQSSVLSYSLNRTPLPLYRNPGTADAAPVEQTIVVKPLLGDDGARYGFVKVIDVTAAVAREQLLKDQSEKMRLLAERHRHGEAKAKAVIENISDALVTMDAEGRVLDLNRAAHALFGYEDEAILGQTFDSLLADSTPLGQLVCGALADTDIRCVRADGSTFPAELRTSRISDDELQRTLVLIRDLTQRRRYEATIFEEKEFAEVTLRSIKEAVITTDAAGLVNSCNPAASCLLGRAGDELIGQSLVELLTLRNPQHREQVARALADALGRAASTELSGDPELVGEHGGVIKIAGCIAALRGQHGQIIGSVTVLQDVSAERRMQEVLSYQATHDELTELINRREFEHRLDEIVSRAGSQATGSVMLYLDLDQFKLINDTCGHAAGDALLRQLTGIMKLQVRQSDTFARLGGDEFGVLLPGCAQEAGLRIANALRDTVKQFRFHWKGSSYGVGVSIGLVAIDGSWRTVADVMSAADSACYMAKDGGRDQVVVYQPAGDKEQRRRGEISQAARIRESLEKNRFRLYCQPIVPLAGDLCRDWGIEVLIRMVDDDGSLVPPGAFIPAAERYDLMTYIDRWVVDSVCRHWERQPRDLQALDKIAINLSGLSVANDEFLQFLIERVDASALPWRKVCLEITETAAVNSIEKAQHMMAELSGRGCRFSLDDFGSGLSSFAYLKNLPVDYLKIDGAFVRDMLNDPMDAAMVRSISDIGRALGLQTIAEFVEDASVMSALRAADVDYAQGYGICRPMPLQDLQAWMDQAASEPTFGLTA